MKLQRVHINMKGKIIITEESLEVKNKPCNCNLIWLQMLTKTSALGKSRGTFTCFASFISAPIIPKLQQKKLNKKHVMV